MPFFDHEDPTKNPVDLDSVRKSRKIKSLLSQGAEANRSGEVGQRIFEGYWQALKVKIVNDHPSHHETQMFPRNDRILIRQPRIEFLHRVANADYLYKDYGRNLDMLFEIRSQLGGGTTDEKLISSVETLASCPYANCCLVLFGPGFRRWVRIAAENKARELSNANKQIRVINDAGDVLYRHLTHLRDFGSLR